jgi:thymidine kinase
MDIYLAGLDMTSEQEPFLIMPQILAISDERVAVKASCYDCGREASYTYYDGKKDEAIKVGDEGYFPLCARCLLKRRGMEGMKKVLRLEKKNED